MSSPPATAEQAPQSEDTPTRWFAEEVHPHDSSLKAYLRGSFPMVHDVEDVVQESYSRVLKARAAEPITSVRAFLFRVARNVALDLVRRSRISPIRAVPDLGAMTVIEEGRSAVETMVVREEIALLAEALDTLPPRCREIIMLRKFQNLSQKAVAAQLGISELTVQEQVYRGLRRCEAFLLKRGVIRPWHHE